MRIDATYAPVRFGYTQRQGRDAAGQDARRGTAIRALLRRLSRRGWRRTPTAAQPLAPMTPAAAACRRSASSRWPSKHLIFQENQRGVTFDALFGPYLQGRQRDRRHRSVHPALLPGAQPDGTAGDDRPAEAGR